MTDESDESVAISHVSEPIDVDGQDLLPPADTPIFVPLKASHIQLLERRLTEAQADANGDVAVRVEISFRDARGHYWRRDRDGELEDVWPDAE